MILDSKASNENIFANGDSIYNVCFVLGGCRQIARNDIFHTKGVILVGVAMAIMNYEVFERKVETVRTISKEFLCLGTVCYEK